MESGVRMGRSRASGQGPRALRAAVLSATGALVEHLESRVLLANVFWDGGGDDFHWNNPLNWNTDAVPGATDDVTIDVPTSNSTITLVGSQSAKSVHSVEPIGIDGGTLTVDRIEAPSLSLVNGGVLTTFEATTTEVHKLEVDVAGLLSVDAASRIDVSVRGYLPGRTKGN